MGADISAHKGELKVEMDDFVDHFLARGNVTKVIQACISTGKIDN